MSVQLKDLVGSWYINQSNFPMWLKGDKTNPRFYYQIATKRGQQGLLDVVSYQKNNKIHQIKGFDQVTTPDNQQFLWRGKGWLSWVTSQWSILYLAPQKDWAIIYFEKTWLTPTGYDVISRYPQLSIQQAEAVQDQLQQQAVSVVLTTIPQQINTVPNR